jgi:urease accessory protein
MSRLSVRLAAASATASALLAAPAFAHTGDHAFGMVSGFAHPFFGLDHLLAMLAVGLWAAQNRHSAFWLLPLVFPLMMALGAMAGMAELQAPGVEAGIAGSVAVLGLLIAFAIRMPVWAGSLVVALFALAHGFAHGVELPAGASPLRYGLGFIAATFMLHLGGLAIGLFAGGTTANRAVRCLGAGIAATGAYLLAGAA